MQRLAVVVRPLQLRQGQDHGAAARQEVRAVDVALHDAHDELTPPEGADAVLLLVFFVKVRQNNMVHRCHRHPPLSHLMPPLVGGEAGEGPERRVEQRLLRLRLGEGRQELGDGYRDWCEKAVWVSFHSKST